jgi:hypothetical protein
MATITPRFCAVTSTKPGGILKAASPFAAQYRTFPKRAITVRPF